MIVLVCIDDILVFSKNKQEHIGHLQVVFAELINHGIIISKKKMELFKPHIKFLGAEIGEGKIKLQDHISKKILDFEDKILNTEELQKFLGLVNYARPYIKDIGKVIGPLYSKTNLKGQKHFNIEDIKLVKKVKEMVKNLPLLRLPLDADYMIIESDGSDLGWGAVLLRKLNKYRSINKGR
jgi:hypothetical protein